MHALARYDAVFGVWIVHFVDFVGEYPGCVEDAARFDGKFVACEGVAYFDAVDFAVAVFVERDDFAVVHYRSAVFDGGLREVYREAGIVKLAVVVADAVAQLFRLDAFKQFIGFGFVEVAGVADAEFAGEAVVEPKAEGVVGRRPPFFARDDECLAFEKVRRVFRKTSAFAQRLAHQIHIALREVTHAAMHQLGTAAGRAFGKVAPLQEQG